MVVHDSRRDSTMNERQGGPPCAPLELDRDRRRLRRHANKIILPAVGDDQPSRWIKLDKLPTIVAPFSTAAFHLAPGRQLRRPRPTGASLPPSSGGDTPPPPVHRARSDARRAALARFWSPCATLRGVYSELVRLGPDGFSILGSNSVAPAIAFSEGPAESAPYLRQPPT